jgi:hypothetical protein
MRIHPLALVALLASEASAFVPNGFLAPSRRTKLSIGEYNLETGLEPPATAVVKKVVNDVSRNEPSSRVEKIREQLRQEIADAEAAREQVLREIEEAEARRQRLEQEAQNSLADADVRRKRLDTFETQQAAAAAAAAAVNPLSGVAAPIAAGTLGAIAFGRSALESRQKKIEEQKRIEEEKARQAATPKSDGSFLGVSKSHFFN